MVVFEHAFEQTKESSMASEQHLLLHPDHLPATTHSYLLRSAESLSEAVGASDVAERYACAHVAALRAAAARNAATCAQA